MIKKGEEKMIRKILVLSILALFLVVPVNAYKITLGYGVDKENVEKVINTIPAWAFRNVDEIKFYNSDSNKFIKDPNGDVKTWGAVTTPLFYPRIITVYRFDRMGLEEAREILIHELAHTLQKRGDHGASFEAITEYYNTMTYCAVENEQTLTSWMKANDKDKMKNFRG